MRYLKKDLWPYQTDIGWAQNEPVKTQIEIRAWCETCIGKRSEDWFDYPQAGRIIFAFKDKDSLLVFKITWGYNGNKKNI